MNFNSYRVTKCSPHPVLNGKSGSSNERLQLFLNEMAHTGVTIIVCPATLNPDDDEVLGKAACVVDEYHVRVLGRLRKGLHRLRRLPCFTVIIGEAEVDGALLHISRP